MKYFLSCDWGTSNFRLRLIDTATRRIAQEVTSDQGIASTHKAWLAANYTEDARINFYKRVLLDAIQKLQSPLPDSNVPIIISGMASSSIGMKELPYSKLPFGLDAMNMNTFRIDGDEALPNPMILVSGCCTDTDIMRGEETILLGCDENETEDIVYILPGTHSKHIMVSKGVVKTFNTYVTGELFELLVQGSVLSNSVSKGMDDVSFSKGVTDALGNNLLQSIFSVRAKHILEKSLPVANYQYLSGLLIGTELKDIKNDSPATIKLVSEYPLLKSYEIACHVIGIKQVELIHADEAFINGHLKFIHSIELSS